jgi:hypothetical protein
MSELVAALLVFALSGGPSYGPQAGDKDEELKRELSEHTSDAATQGGRQDATRQSRASGSPESCFKEEMKGKARAVVRC